ncbi:hypothetical protein ACWDPP_20250, partial [Streptomyces sp. NPDC000851]
TVGVTAARRADELGALLQRRGAAVLHAPALRESSVIVGAAIGAVVFKERFGTPRIVAAGLLVAGIGLMLR